MPDDVDNSQGSTVLYKLLAGVALAIAITAVLFYGKLMLMPLAFGGLIALLVAPIRRKLVDRGAPRSVGLAAAIAVPAIATAGLLFAIGHQATRFAEDWEKIEQRLHESVSQIEEHLPSWSERVPGVDLLTAKGAASAKAPESSDQSSTNNAQDAKPDEKTTGNDDPKRAHEKSAEKPWKMSSIPLSGEMLMGPLSNTVSGVMVFGLMFVYLALLLIEEERLRGFVLRRAEALGARAQAETILSEIGSVARHYLLGRLMVIGVLTVLYAIGFTIGGLPYGLLIALFAAVLSIVPYFGNIVGGVLALLVALTSGGQGPIIAVLVTMVIAQLLENYILTPFVVGDEVNLNPLVTFVSVIAFTLVWGPVGAVIAIPLVGLMRIVCLHIDGYKDYAYLLGNDTADGDENEDA